MPTFPLFKIITNPHSSVSILESWSGSSSGTPDMMTFRSIGFEKTSLERVTLSYREKTQRFPAISPATATTLGALPKTRLYTPRTA